MTIRFDDEEVLPDSAEVEFSPLQKFLYPSDLSSQEGFCETHQYK